MANPVITRALVQERLPMSCPFAVDARVSSCMEHNEAALLLSWGFIT